MRSTSRLGRAREAKGLTQRKLAKRIGVGAEYMSRIENGWVDPSEKLVMRLSMVLELKPDEVRQLVLYARRRRMSQELRISGG